MVALDLDHPVLHGTSGATQGLEGFGKAREFLAFEGHTAYQANPFAFSAFSLTTDSNYSIARR